MNEKLDLILCAVDIIGFITAAFSGKDIAFWAVLFGIHCLFYKVDSKP